MSFCLVTGSSPNSSHGLVAKASRSDLRFFGRVKERAHTRVTKTENCTVR